MSKKAVKTIRIGFTGPSGSGKTTLAKWLAEEIGIPYFEGSASLTHTKERHDELVKQFGYEPKGHANVIKLSAENPDFGLAFQESLLASRAEKIKSIEGSFVTDRTFIDNVVYYMTQCSMFQTEEVTARIADAAGELALTQFTHIIVTTPKEGWTEDNGSRVASNAYQSTVIMPVVDKIAGDLSQFSGDRMEAGDKPQLLEQRILRLNGWDLDLRKANVLEVLKEWLG